MCGIPVACQTSNCQYRPICMKRDAQKRPTKETHKRIPQKRPTQESYSPHTWGLPNIRMSAETYIYEKKSRKETYGKDVQKSPTKKKHSQKSLTVYLRPSTHLHVKRDLFVWKETYKREQQKRPAKETYKRDFQMETYSPQSKVCSRAIPKREQQKKTFIQDLKIYVVPKARQTSTTGNRDTYISKKTQEKELQKRPI